MDGETKTGQEALQPQAGQPSVEEGGSPSNESEKTYTEAEVAQRHSKLDKTIATLTKERDLLKQSSDEMKQQLEELQRRIDEQEEEQAKSNPDSLKIYQKQKELREMEARLKEQQRQLELEREQNAEKLRLADELHAENMVISKALEYHVDIGELKEKAKKFNLSTEEQISELAATLAGASKKPIPKGDSGRGVGGTDLDNMSASELLRYAVSQRK